MAFPQVYVQRLSSVRNHRLRGCCQPCCSLWYASTTYNDRHGDWQGSHCRDYCGHSELLPVTGNDRHSEHASDIAEVLRQVFGDTDSDEEESQPAFGSLETAPFCEPNASSWQPVTGVPGLWQCRNFLSPAQQQTLISCFHSGQRSSRTLVASCECLPGFTRTEAVALGEQRVGFRRRSRISSYLCVAQVMRFFDLPKWALSLSSLIQQAVAALMPPTPSHGPSPSDERGWLAAEIVQREPFFNQMIANSYEPSEGIKSHTDLLRFEDGIAVLSLGSPCVMTFQKITELVPKHTGGQDCVRDRDTAIASDSNHGCCRGKAGGEAGGGGRQGGVGERCEEVKDTEIFGGVWGSERGMEEGIRARERRCERDEERKQRRLGGGGASQKEVIHRCVGSNNYRCSVDGVEDRVRGDRCHRGQSGSWEGRATSACGVEKVHDDVSLPLSATDVTSSPECAVGTSVPVLLGVGDLLIMSGEARYDWSHGIHRGLEHQVWKGGRVECRKRMSLTLRRMCEQE